MYLENSEKTGEFNSTEIRELLSVQPENERFLRFSTNVSKNKNGT